MRRDTPLLTGVDDGSRRDASPRGWTMYLFSRTARLVPGNQAASMAWALTLTEKVNQIAEIDVTLWTRVFSPGVGELTWTAIVDDLSLLENTDAKLMADTGFQMLADEGAKMLGSEGLTDGLAQFITPFTAPEAGAAAPNYANIVTATLAPGSMANGIAVGLEIAERAGEVTGLPVSFLSAVTGVYGAVEWVATCDTVQQLQAAQTAITSDAKLIELIDKKGGTVYQPNAEQFCVRRLA